MRRIFATFWLALALCACGYSGPVGDIYAVDTPASGGLIGGATSGTPSLSLKSCSDGQVLKPTGGVWGCAVDNGPGTGTTNTLAMWTSSSTLGNSPLVYDGSSNLSTNKNLTINENQSALLQIGQFSVGYPWAVIKSTSGGAGIMFNTNGNDRAAITSGGVLETYGGVSIGNDATDPHSLRGTLSLQGAAGSDGQVIRRASGIPTWANVIASPTTCTDQLVSAISATGAGTCSSVGSAMITDGDVALTDMANLAQATLIGRASGAGTGTPTALTPAQATAILDVFSTSATTKGLVPGSNGVGATRYLDGTGAWSVPAGSTYSAGTGLDLTANVFSIASGGVDVTQLADNLDLSANGTTTLGGVNEKTETLTGGSGTTTLAPASTTRTLLINYGSLTIAGISGGWDGRALQLCNISASTASLAHQSVSATDLNRFALPSGGTYLAAQNVCRNLKYIGSGSTGRWFLDESLNFPALTISGATTTSTISSTSTAQFATTNTLGTNGLSIDRAGTPTQSQLIVRANSTSAGAINLTTLAADSSYVTFDAEYIASGWVARDTSAGRITKNLDYMLFDYAGGLTSGSAVSSWTTAMNLNLTSGAIEVISQFTVYGVTAFNGTTDFNAAANFDSSATFNSGLTVNGALGDFNAGVSLDGASTLSTTFTLNSGGVIRLPNGTGTIATQSNGSGLTLTSCGTSPTYTGSRTAGTVTTGSSATACTITFSAAFSNTPTCVVSPRASASALNYTTSTTALTFSSASASASYDFHCFDRY